MQEVPSKPRAKREGTDFYGYLGPLEMAAVIAGKYFLPPGAISARIEKCPHAGFRKPD